MVQTTFLLHAFVVPEVLATFRKIQCVDLIKKGGDEERLLFFEMCMEVGSFRLTDAGEASHGITEIEVGITINVAVVSNTRSKKRTISGINEELVVWCEFGWNFGREDDFTAAIVVTSIQQCEMFSIDKGFVNV